MLIQIKTETWRWRKLIKISNNIYMYIQDKEKIIKSFLKIQIHRNVLFFLIVVVRTYSFWIQISKLSLFYLIESNYLPNETFIQFVQMILWNMKIFCIRFYFSIFCTLYNLKGLVIFVYKLQYNTFFIVYI